MTLKSINAEVINKLRRFSNFIIFGHEQPDADCLCSQIGLAALLKEEGKSVSLLSAGPFSRPEIRDKESLFQSQWPDIPTHLKNDTLVILLDCSTMQRTGFDLELIKQFPVMVIDHHAKGDVEGDFHHIDPASPSTTLLIQKIWEEFNRKPSAEVAEELFFGFATDTGFFRHLVDHSGAAFEAVAKLVDWGASPNRIHRKISSGRSLGTRRLMGRILERSRSYFEGQLILSWEDAQDRIELGTDDRDSDKLYETLQSIEGCESVALIRDDGSGQCIIGLRSNNDIDVSSIAAQFGGGGHKKASGAACSGSRNEIQEQLLSLFSLQMTQE